MKLTEYLICFKCFKKATWQYAGDSRFACDECLPRGECACCFELKPGVEPVWNHDETEMMNTSGDFQIIVDDENRPIPCVDWNPL